MYNFSGNSEKNGRLYDYCGIVLYIQCGVDVVQDVCDI